MIKVDLPDRTLGIAFKHEPKMKIIGFVPNRNYAATQGEPIKKEIRTTKCEIYEVVGTDARLVGHAKAECSLTDNFNKAVGRKVALTRALEFMKMGKAYRTIVWEAYNTRG